jgi:RNA polymerase sigma-70 factor (ECF subfamily)
MASESTDAAPTYLMLIGTSGSDDADLVREVIDGSHDALAALYDRYAEGVYAVARRLTRDRQMAEEVVQETFLALWNRAELFDSELGSLPAWLHTIARNRTVDRLRAAGRRPSLVALSAATREDESVDAAMDRLATTGKAVSASVSQPDPESAAVGAWTRRRLHEALAGMPEDERTVIVMAYDDELSQSEIAGRLGWPIGTVKTRTRRALRRLRAMLETDLGPERALTEPAFAGRGGTDAAR